MSNNITTHMPSLLAELRTAALSSPTKVDPAAVLAILDDHQRITDENIRMRELLAEKVVSSTQITGIDMNTGTIGFEGGACGWLAEAFGEQLFTSGAENYIELTMTSGKYPDLGQIAITVKRETGKTPHQLRALAEQQRDELAPDARRYRAFKAADMPNGLGVYDDELDLACDQLADDQEENARLELLR